NVADDGVFERLAVEQNTAAIRLCQSCNHVDDCRLAATVGPEDTGDFVLWNIELKVLVQRIAGIPFRQFADSDMGADLTGPEGLLLEPGYGTCVSGHNVTWAVRHIGSIRLVCASTS